MKLFKSLIIIALLLCAFQTQAQTQAQYIDTKCAELSQDEARAELELKRIRNERVKLNASKVELSIALYHKQLTDLDLKKAADIARIEAEYLRAKGDIQARITVATSVQFPSCTN